jgi:hypothetical protein
VGSGHTSCYDWNRYIVMNYKGTNLSGHTIGYCEEKKDAKKA